MKTPLAIQHKNSAAPFHTLSLRRPFRLMHFSALIFLTRDPRALDERQVLKATWQDRSYLSPDTQVGNWSVTVFCRFSIISKKRGVRNRKRLKEINTRVETIHVRCFFKEAVKQTKNDKDF